MDKMVSQQAGKESTQIGRARDVYIDLVAGINNLPTDYAARIQNFLTEYLGTPACPTPFGGREADLALLDAWLTDADASPYLMLAAAAGRGKSALLSRWSQRLLQRGGRETPNVVFVPVSIRFRTNLASVVFAALAARLAYLHEEDVPMQLSGAEMSRGLVSDYLSRPLPRGDRVLVILDGVDEAADWDLGPDLFPLSPPGGLRVVVSARYQAGDVGAAGWMRRLGWDRLGLAWAPGLAPLSSRGVADVLTKMDVPLDCLARNVDLVSELYRLSQGDPLLVRLYVDELWTKGEAATRLQPEDLQAIEPGLEGYFDRWWADQRELWGKQAPLKEKGVQVLLSLMACALGPLVRRDLLVLADDEDLTTWALEEALLPLARFVVGDGERQGYAFGHPRLSDYFYARLSEPEREKWNERFLAWGRRAVADLESGVLSPKRAPAYLVQYYGAHLDRSRAGLKALTSLTSGVWRQAWEALGGTYDGFLNDARRAWQAAEEANAEATTQGELARWLGVETRCALCQASVNTLAQRIPPQLLAALVREKTWMPEQALGYARQTPDAGQRARALAELVPHLPERLLRQTLATARDIEVAEYRDAVLARLVPRLAEVGHPPQGVPVAREIESDRWRAEALAGLPANLPEGRLHEALEVARKIDTDWWRDKAVASLVLHLARLGHPREALAVTREIEAGCWWAQALGELIPYLPEDLHERLLHEALAMARETESDRRRGEALVGLAPHLVERLLWEALQAAREIESDWRRAKTLAGLVPHLAKLGHQLEALAEAREIGDVGARAEALAGLASHLPEGSREELLHEALAAAAEISNAQYQAGTLIALTPHLPEALQERALREALTAAQQIQDAEHRAEALAGLALYLPEDLREPVLEEALGAVRRIGDARYQAEALVALVPLLAELGYPRQALAAARNIKNTHYQAETLAALVLRLAELGHSQEALAAAGQIKDAQCRAKTLVGLVSHLAKLGHPQEALGALRQIPKGESRADALAAAVAHLPDEVLVQALAVTREVERDWWRTEELAGLVPDLAKLGHPRDALAAVQTIDDDKDRAKTLAALAPHLPQAMLCDALVEAQGIGNERCQADVLMTLAPHLPEELLDDALRLAGEIEDTRYRAEALAELASHLPGELVRDAVGLARDSEDPRDRARTLAALASHLPEDLLWEVLNLTERIEDAGDRAEVLAQLIPHLPDELLLEALELAEEIQNASDRAETLIELAPHLPPAVRQRTLREVVAALRQISDPLRRVEALIGLIPRLPDEVMWQALPLARAAAREIGDELRLAEAFARLIPSLAELGHPRAALSAAREIEDAEYRARALDGLAPYLPDEMLQQAIGEASKIDGDRYQAEALLGLVAQVPAGRLHEALERVREIESDRYRAHVLTGIVSRLCESGEAQEALELVPEIPDPSFRAQALVGLALPLRDVLQEAGMREALKRAIEIESERYRVEALMGLSAHLPEALQKETLEELATIESEPNRARALEGVSSHLADGLHELALEEARGIQAEQYRGQALMGLALHLPERLLRQALVAALEIERTDARAKVLARLVPRLVAWAQEPVPAAVTTWQEALHTFAARTRRDLLVDLRALAPLVGALGGREALTDSIRAIQDVGAWWP